MEGTFKAIEKEQVGTLRFPNQDVLTSEADIKERKSALERALKLGNLEHGKVKIYFEDDNQRLYTYTTIWGVTEERVILKKGVYIPNNRIYKID